MENLTQPIGEETSGRVAGQARLGLRDIIKLPEELRSFLEQDLVFLKVIII